MPRCQENIYEETLVENDIEFREFFKFFSFIELLLYNILKYWNSEIHWTFWILRKFRGMRKHFFQESATTEKFAKLQRLEVCKDFFMFVF